MESAAFPCSHTAATRTTCMRSGLRGLPAEDQLGTPRALIWCALVTRHCIVQARRLHGASRVLRHHSTSTLWAHGALQPRSALLCVSPSHRFHGAFSSNGNDPAAGSPTTTLLRLLLPLAAGHCPISAETQSASWPPDGSIQLPSVATTGGVYKWQGHNLCELMTHAY